MGETDFGAITGKQWRESQDTRTQFGLGDTIVWYENHPEEIQLDVVNIISRKSYAGDTFTLGVHLLGSYHPYQTTERFNLGSYFGGCKVSNGSLSLETGSTSGSWFSPTLKYSETEILDTAGSVTDTASTTWRYLTYDYGGSVLINILNSTTLAVLGSFDATGSDNLANVTYLPQKQAIRLNFELGSPTSFVGSVYLAFKQAKLGSGLVISNNVFSENRIYQEYTEDFMDTGSIDLANSTGSILEAFSGSVIEDFSTTVKQIENTAYWDTAGSKLAMSNLSEHMTIYNSYSLIGNLSNTGSIIRRLTLTGSEIKWNPTDIIKYYVSNTNTNESSFEEVTLGNEHIFTANGSNIYLRTLFIGNGADSTYVQDLRASYDVLSGGYWLYPNTQVQSLSLSEQFILTDFDRIKLDITGSDILGSVDFYVSSANSDNFYKVQRSIEYDLDTSIGSKVKWKAIYTQATGSALLKTIDIIYKGEDYS